jgi:predicted nucleotidyltransferase
MNREQVIGRLRENADAIRGMGATALYLFGSTIREDATTESDIDLFIDYDSNRFSLVDLVGIKQFLEEAMLTEVDITTRNSLHPMLRDEIEQSAVRVF